MVGVPVYSRETVADCLSTISSLFLINAPGLGSEARVRLSDTTCRLTRVISRDLVTDADRLEETVRELRRNAQTIGSNRNVTVGRAIAQASTLEKQDDIQAAIATLQDAKRLVGAANGRFDLIAYLGHLHLKSDPPNFNAAREACRDAFKGGLRNNRLFETWFESEWTANNFPGAEECARAAIADSKRPDFVWHVRLAAALKAKAYEQAAGQLGVNVLGIYIEAGDELSKAIKCSSTAKAADWRAELEANNDLIWTILSKPTGSAAESYAAAKRMADLIEQGDKRIKNYLRVMDLISQGAMQEKELKEPLRGEFSLSNVTGVFIRLYQHRLSRFPDEQRLATLNERFNSFLRKIGYQQ